MRIIAGRFRGVRLRAPAGRVTRPITDRVKESLFSILGHRLATPGAIPPVAVLDVFAGTGSLGLEALSRGAASCVFVERDPQALRRLRDNIRQLKLEAVTRIERENAWTMRVPRPVAAERYGLIFVDPPYRDAANAEALGGLLERLTGRLAADGLLVLRHSVHHRPAALDVPRLQAVDERTFGEMHLRIMQRHATRDAPPRA